jgi:glycolate oxidase FAD binding subunit
MDPSTKSTSGAIHSPLRYKLIAMVGPERLRPALPADAVAGIQPKLVIEPGSEGEVAAALKILNEADLAVVPRGGGTKLRWGNSLLRADVILSTVRLDEIIDHAWSDLTVSVEAGCTVGRLQQALAEHGQRLALDPLVPEFATIGGILSANDSGALRLRFGALRDLIIGVTIALPDGTLASSGGRVVKNVAGYDLPKLVTGAMGTLGIITRAIFRLHPLPHNSRSFSISTSETSETQSLVHSIQNSKLAHASLQSRFSDSHTPVTDVLIEGTTAGITSQENQLRALAKELKFSEVEASVWSARQGLWSFADPENTAIAKISLLPAQLARTIETIAQTAATRELRWNSVVQAHGLGWLRLEGHQTALHGVLSILRDALESRGGSLVRLHAPQNMPSFDAWGKPGDALSLMKAVKFRLDPKSTLNPGRFVGGI